MKERLRMGGMEWKQGQKILFIGDSITDAQRCEAPHAPLGRGYVYFAGCFLQAAFPHLDLQIENRGISGDTSRELLRRWKRDCLDLCPDVVSILIGINDLWRQFKPIFKSHKTPVSAAEYEDNLRQMLSAAAAIGSRVILMEPFYFCYDLQDPMRKALKGYLNAVHRLAEEYKTLLIPLQQAYEQIKEGVPEPRWSPDRVHPYPWAHAWITRQWLTTVA